MIEYILYVIIFLLIIIGLSGIKIIRPTEKGLVETLGKYSRTAEQGFSWIFPRIQNLIKVNITERRVDVEPQTIITKDKLNAIVDAVVYYKVQDIKKAIYNVQDFKTSVPSLARTTLRAVIGKMSLSEANENRSKINVDVEKELDKQTDDWGISIIRVELQTIEPPKDVQAAMNMVVKAENEKIAALDTATALETKADGQKRAEIKVAEGKRQASILEAEGKAKSFELIEKSFSGKAQLLKKLEVTQASLENNSKIIITDKGINPQLIIGDLPISKK
jgi:regulator of protease activity HflC (stomatin/prohibitin superfamily)